MVGSAVGFLVINAASVLMFTSFFFEYYVARHDLSEAQVNAIVKKLPDFLEPYLFMRRGNVEKLVKNASMSLPLTMIVFTLVMPIATIGNMYIEWTANRPLLVVVYLFILLGCAYAVFRFFQILRGDDLDEAP